MVTILVAAATLWGCTAVRRYLNGSRRVEKQCLHGRMKLKILWNEGAAFGLPVRPSVVIAASSAVMAFLWTQRREHPVSTGMILGGGISNLLERLTQGAVCDYVHFPKAVGRVKKYVYNLADFAIFIGGIGLLFHQKKR